MSPNELWIIGSVVVMVFCAILIVKEPNKHGRRVVLLGALFMLALYAAIVNGVFMTI